MTTGDDCVVEQLGDMLSYASASPIATSSGVEEMLHQLKYHSTASSSKLTQPLELGFAGSVLWRKRAETWPFDVSHDWAVLPQPICVG